MTDEKRISALRSVSSRQNPMFRNKPLSVKFRNPDDLGTLCICALRYAMGRQTYMPSLVREIIRPLFPKLSDKDITVMLDDCEYQKKYNIYGDDTIDKPGWILWKQELILEQDRRRSLESATVPAT